ncbi:hypothetical protein CSUI_010197 [Cystoisospora suis]|uniref:Transmembrane protein n=1 Tax=Cystoisospora suis TaxID=483139 RepID=A0A2C6JZA8_9APIC|nr:hypothetical protein CSUI_010197 [Cystoisospora suis]
MFPPLVGFFYALMCCAAVSAWLLMPFQPLSRGSPPRTHCYAGRYPSLHS